MVLSLLVTGLALVDSYIHLRLSGFLFGGPGGGGGPPADVAMSQFLLPLDQLLLLNGIGYAVLVVFFWLGPIVLGRRRWLTDLLMVMYTLATIASWYYVGMPNPMNLGYLSKTVEAVLLIALLVHIRAVTARTPWRP